MDKENWIDWVQIGVIGVLAPFFLFPSMKYVWILCVVPGIWIWRWIYKRNLVERTVLDLGILILIIQVFATLFVVTDVAFSLGKIAGIIFGIAVFYAVVALLRTEKLIKAGIIFFLCGSFLFSIIGVLGMIEANPKHLAKTKIYKISTLVPSKNFYLPGAEEGFHSNAVGGTMVLIVPIFLILFFSYLRQKDKSCFLFEKKIVLVRSLLFGGAFVTVCVLLLTQSRGSWIGIIIGCWLVLLSNWKSKKWGLVFILAIILGIGLSTESIPKTYKNAKLKLNERIQLYKFGVEIIGDYPLTGIGMNYVRTLPEVSYSGAHLHNHLIHTAAELGIPALVAYLAILFGAGWMCYKVWLESDIGWIKAAALGLGAGQLAHFIFGMGDSIPLGAKTGIFFWMSLALITAMYKTVEEEKD